MYPRILFRSGLAAAILLGAANAQERKSRIHLDSYVIDVDINQHTQSLAAKAAVKFTPLDDNENSVSFELNNALNVSKVLDEQNREVPVSRTQQDFSVHVNFNEYLQKSKPTTVTVFYDGRLTGQEDSPIYGIKFAAIQNDYAYLLYPGRWFPIAGYTTDRYSAQINVTVAQGYKVLGSGIDTKQAAGDRIKYSFQFDRASFPGSIAVVKDDPPVKAASEGVTTTLYFRGPEASMANVYGVETGKIVSYFTGLFGMPPVANLTVVETEAGAPNGYSAPGLIFVNPRGIGKDVNTKLLANQVSRQWWGGLLSPATRNHLWLSNGLANYSEMMYNAQVNGPSALANEVRDSNVEALTIDNVPVIQAGRMEDYSPELLALTGSKGAAVLHMLRGVIGDEKFFQALKGFAAANAWKTVTTDGFKEAVEKASAQNLGYFFIQWIESSGAPEFKLEYTIFRTQKGFRAMGKIAQDLDTFRMPVDLKIETEGNPELKHVEVMGTSSEFSVDTFGKPKSIVLDPDNRVLAFSNQMRVAVAIRRGEQFFEVSEFGEALKEYQKALEANRIGSLAHYRIAEVFLQQGNYQSAANEFRAVLEGDLQPKWTEVWSHVNLGRIFDVTGQRDRAVNEYKQAERTKDNTQGALEEAAKYLKTPYERPKRAEQ